MRTDSALQRKRIKCRLQNTWKWESVELSLKATAIENKIAMLKSPYNKG